MAVSVLGNGMLQLTTVGDTWPDKIKLCGGIFCYTTDTAGTFELKNSDGAVIYRSGAMNANEVRSEDLVGWVKGVVVSSIPANGRVLLQHE